MKEIVDTTLRNIFINEETLRAFEDAFMINSGMWSSYVLDMETGFKRGYQGIASGATNVFLDLNVHTGNNIPRIDVFSKEGSYYYSDLDIYLHDTKTPYVSLLHTPQALNDKTLDKRLALFGIGGEPNRVLTDIGMNIKYAADEYNESR